MDVYLVEDELFSREELKYILLQNKEVCIVGEAEDIQHALWDIHQLHPDVVFLDIELTNGTGLDLAKQLKMLKKPPFIVFATAYDEYAVDAFELEAVDYLVKPFNEKRTIETIEKLLRWQQSRSTVSDKETGKVQHNGKLVINQDEKYIVINTEDILYVGSENRQAFVKTLKQEHYIDLALYEIEQKLAPDSFIRVHRGYIVNLHNVTEIERWFNNTFNLKLIDGSKVPVSRSYMKKIRTALQF